MQAAAPSAVRPETATPTLESILKSLRCEALSSEAARLSVACGRRACYAKPARALRRRNAPRFVMTRRRAGDGDATAPLPFVAAARGAVSLMIGRMRPSRGGLAKSNSTPGEFYF